jgi:hypothetical protein
MTNYVLPVKRKAGYTFPIGRITRLLKCLLCMGLGAHRVSQGAQPISKPGPTQMLTNEPSHTPNNNNYIISFPRYENMTGSPILKNRQVTWEANFFCEISFNFECKKLIKFGKVLLFQRYCTYKSIYKVFYKKPSLTSNLQRLLESGSSKTS